MSRFLRWLSSQDATARYVGATAAYGAARKLALTHDAQYVQTEYQNGAWRDRAAPMLAADRLVVAAAGALTAVYVWPVYLWLDAQRAEIRARGLDPDDYDRSPRTRSIVDYLFI